MSKLPTVPVLLAAALLISLGCSSSTSEGSGMSGTIIFAREDLPSDWNVYRINPATGDEEILTDNAEDDVYPVWFPDHSKIAYISERDTTGGIYIMDPDGSNSRLVWADTMEKVGVRNIVELSISPSGDQIAFSYLGLIRVLTLADTSIRQLAVGLEPAWSPDGAWIGYTTQADGIGLIRPDSSEFRMLIEDAGARELSWSRNGERIVYTQALGPEHRLFTANADGTNREQLTESRTAIQDLGGVFSPDGRWIAFQRDVVASCAHQVCVMLVPARGGDADILTSGLRPSW